MKEILKITQNQLRSCYATGGIIAGLHHFTDYWARDGYFASLGSLAIGDTEIIIKMVRNFMFYQRKDGLIPYRIMRGPITLGKYFGKPAFYANPRPTFRLRGIGSEVLDGTTLTILFVAILGINQWHQAKNYIPNVKKSLNYLLTKEKNGLLCDGFMTEWNDTSLKFGNLLYSNIIYWYLFERLSTWTKTFDSVWSSNLNKKKETIAFQIRKILWNERFFADWYDYKQQNYFNSFANCLAIAWGLTNSAETESILNNCQKAKINFTLETNFPKYPFWRIDLIQRLLGMGDYQNMGLLWLQPALAYIKALKKVNKKNEAQKLIDLISDKIIRDKWIYECYERNGLQVKRLFYSSEKPFAWSAGMLIWAISD